MKPGNIVLLQTISNSQPENGFKFKKMKTTPARIYEKNVIIVVTICILLMAAESFYTRMLR